MYMYLYTTKTLYISYLNNNVNKYIYIYIYVQRIVPMKDSATFIFVVDVYDTLITLIY